jgi:hypothetical protein
MLNYDDNCFKSYNQKSEILSELRDLYADIYRTKLGHPRRSEKAWPMRKLEVGAGQWQQGPGEGRSRSVKSHYIKYEKPQYTV